MERSAIVFYKSFDEAISMLSDEDQLKAYRAIVKYGLYGENPDIDGVAGAVFLLAKPQIDANNRRYENGKQGGRPKKTEEPNIGTEAEPKANLKETERKPNKNQNETKEEPKEKEKEKEKEKVKEKNNNNKALTAAQIEHVFEAAWRAYPEKKGKGRVSAADKKRLAEIGEANILKAIERYKNEVQGQDWRHWQNGSTFFHSGYIDYLDENYEESAQKRGRPPNSKFNNEVKRDYDMRELELRLLTGN